MPTFRKASRARIACSIALALAAAAASGGQAFAATVDAPAYHTDGAIRCLPSDGQHPAHIEIDPPSIYGLPGGQQSVYWRAWVYEQSAEHTGWLNWANVTSSSPAPSAWQSYLTTPDGPVTDENIITLSNPNFAVKGAVSFRAPTRANGGHYFIYFQYFWAPRSTAERWVYAGGWAGRAGVTENYWTLGDFAPIQGTNCDFTSDYITLTSPS